MLNTILLIVILVVAVAALIILILNRVEDEKDYRLFDKYTDVKQDNSNLWDYVDYLTSMIDDHNESLTKNSTEHELHYHGFSRWLHGRLDPEEEEDKNMRPNSF